jgi:hypothetical protein
MPSNPPPAGPARRRFALTGPSTRLDPRTNAVRRDIADIRLAELVFAPHYAAPLAMGVEGETILRAEPSQTSDTVAILKADEIFEVLEFSGGNAWGIAPAHGLVGYLDAGRLSALVS